MLHGPSSDQFFLLSLFILYISLRTTLTQETLLINIFYSDFYSDKPQMKPNTLLLIVLSTSSKLYTLLQIAYAVIMLPVLVVSIKLSPRLHKILAAPLISGPFNGQLNSTIQDLIYQLEAQEITDEQFIQCVAQAMLKAIEDGQLDKFLNLVDEKNTNLDITLKRCLGYLPLKWWYIKMHYMAPGNRHQLHAHRNVISAQIIVRGSLAAEQYNLIGNLDSSPTQLEAVPLSDQRGHQVLLSTNSHCNVHGFEPTESGALRFQFYLRGHTSFLNRIPKRGRLYVHPHPEPNPNGYILADIGRAGRPGES